MIEESEIKQKLIKTVNILSHDIGSRSYTEIENLEKAASFIEGQFKSNGYVAKRQSFKINGKFYHNVFSEIAGTGLSDEKLVLGAHYDTVYGTPGADDNASGIAVLLELSRLIAIQPLSYTVNLVAFTLEEPPFFRTRHMGSYIFAENLKKKNIKVKGMISIESVGYFSYRQGTQFYPLPLFKWFYPNAGDYIAFVGNLHSKAFTNRFVKIFKDVSSLKYEALNTVSFVLGVDFSDHRSFWHFDYPAFMATDTAFYRNPNYHGSGDTAGTLDYDKMTELVIGIYRTFQKI
jgi:Zn-dependent M28 family amino/carboxypeptidase